MELKQIKELMAAMERAGIKKLAIKEKTGFEIQLERQEEGTVHHAPAPSYHPVYTSHSFPHRDTEHHHPRESHGAHHSIPRTPAEQQEKQEKKEEGKFVSSPMVGTFYSSSSPDDPSFVKVGDRVEENTVVCIIEAMKVMNEVKAGVSGVIAEICIQNAHPVEFGTKIFRIV